MTEVPIDPRRYHWVQIDDTADDIPVVRTYRLAITRTIRVGHHTLLRTKIVYSTNPHPRIPGAVYTNKETNQ